MLAFSVSEAPEATVALPGAALIGRLEDACDALYGQLKADPADLLIDLSETTFVEVPTLQYIISLAVSRHRSNRFTRMRIPGGDEGILARDYLRRIEFPQAVYKATGIRFQNFVVAEDLQYFKGLGGDQHELSYSLSKRQRFWRSRSRSETGASSSMQEGLEEERFWPFTTWPLGEYLDKGRAADEALDDWSVQTVLSVLNRYLRAPGEVPGASPDKGDLPSAGIYVGSRIVFEAMTNAVRHPGAACVQSASVLRTNNKEGVADYQSGHFTMTFWDDGASIIKTLRDAIDKKLDVRYKYPESFDTSYRYRFSTSESTIAHSPEIVRSAETPTVAMSDDRLLLSAFYPGVTCDVAGSGHRVTAELSKSEPSLATQGMGLFALCRTVIDCFGGTLAVRTGDYFMNVKAAKSQGCRYDVKVVKKPPYTPPFLGNMLTVRLPLRRQQGRSR